MSEENQHVNRRSTGTVPKQRIRYTRSVTEVDRLRSLSNSSSDYYHDSYNELRSPRRSNQIVDTHVQSHGVPPNQIGSINLNSVGSSIPSSTASRKNSFGSTLKCDNITKHPNKKQIEDKLNQIHEYLKVTNSLMASIKKVDNQVLAQNDELVIESDFSSKKNDITLKEHESSSLLQRKSDNKCLSPRQNRSNLLLEACNHMNTTSNKGNRNDIYFESSFKEQEEKNRKLHPNPQLIPTQDKSIVDMESLLNHTINMPNINDNVEQLFDTLAFSDAELASQHDELHKKIIELQNRKLQIDQFISQLQTSGGHGEDVEQQMVKICAMKAQLKKLKNMLEIIKMPLNLENSNNPHDYEKTSCYLCSTTNNIGEKIKSGIRNESNIFNRAFNSGNDGRSKQLNTNPMENNKLQMTKANISSMSQNTTLQSELESKKRELVEIMEKHKVNPSNLNQDFGMDTKSDICFLMNGINDPWRSVISNDSDSDRFSSDDYQNDTHPEIKHNFLLPSPKYSSTITNSQTENLQHGNFEFRAINRGSYTPEANYRSSSVGTTTNKNKSQISNSQNLHTSQMQKQLEIIRSMCDSMLEHQNNQETYSNQQNLQNNQNNSSQRFTSPHQQNSSRNSDNGENSEIQMEGIYPTVYNNPNNFRQETNNSNYNNLLTTNSIQTQSFVLNTLNQCYQMLWIQQKELTSLKNNVLVLQERLKTNHFEVPVDAPSQTPSCHQQPNLENKINQDAYTIPVTNQFDCPISSVYFNSVNNGNSQPVDPCLNNINLNRLNEQNSEHGIPGNINHLMPNHIWSGQALNNQVVPGNRANNYWDNFRSYSRQNLFSTKNIEILQNLPSVVDRPNFINQCANPFAFMSFSKSNSDQDSLNTSQESTFQGMPFKETNPVTNFGTHSMVGVTNTDTIKNNEGIESPSKDTFHKDNNSSHFGLPLAHNLRPNPEDHSNGLIISKEHIPEIPKRPDQRNKSTEECQCSKSTFEDMKENIYKEVASLISANENRPQFLIQLFRDLQLVKSDNVRENVLHSIERNICNPHISQTNLNPQSVNPPTYLQSTPSLVLKTVSISSSNNDYITCKNILQEIQVFIDRNLEIIIQNNFFISLKDFLLNLQSFRDTFKDKSCRNDVINILENDLQKYFGKRLGDIKLQLFQRIHDLVYEKHQLAYFADEPYCTDNKVLTNAPSVDDSANKELTNLTKEAGLTPTNEDLAEADQSQTVNEDFAEEGAVGGILDTSQIKQNEANQLFDPISIRPPNQARSEPSNRESYQSAEDSDVLEIQNNVSIYLDKQ